MYSQNLPDAKWQILLVVFILVSSGCLITGCRKPVDSPTIEASAREKTAIINIYTEQEGLHYFTFDDLAKLQIDTLPEDYRKLHLSLRGVSQPLWIIAGEDDPVVLFYARASESRYVKTNVYQLMYGEGVSDDTQIVDESMLSTTTTTAVNGGSYLHPIMMEENHVYYPQVETGDHWLWNNLTAAEEQTFKFSVDNLTNGIGKVTLMVWGNADVNIAPDHHIKVFVNDEQIADHRWDGGGWQKLDAEVRDALLVSGENTLIIKLPGDTGAVAENMHVNWVEITYTRQPVANNGVLNFGYEDAQLKLREFSGEVMVFDITDKKQVFLFGQYRPERGDFVFIGEKGHQYYAVDRRGWRKPVQIAMTQGSLELFSPNRGVDYLAIGDADLLKVVDPLLAFHQEHGLKTGVVQLNVIYDQFNYGFAEPEAIQRFLRHIASHWETVPRYVLLIGDSTYDPLGYISEPPEYNLPTFFIQTAHGGETASDVMFGMLDDDGLPDLALGRIPARTASELKDWVAKQVIYNQNKLSGGVAGNVVAIADGQEPSFQLEAEQFLDQFLSPYETELIASIPGEKDTSELISKAIMNNAYVVSYFGHGSITMWGKDRIFTVEDVDALTEPPAQIMVHMTCLTGFFTHPEFESLTEALLFNPDGGALTILAPTSLTLPIGQSGFSQSLGFALSDEKISRLGDAYLYAQRQVNMDGMGAEDVLLTFLLFGDPAQGIH